jgi:hypothetical protein
LLLLLLLQLQKIFSPAAAFKQKTASEAPREETIETTTATAKKFLAVASFKGKTNFFSRYGLYLRIGDSH